MARAPLAHAKASIGLTIVFVVTACSSTAQPRANRAPSLPSSLRTSTTVAGSTADPLGYVRVAMGQTYEVRFPDEHFKPSGDLISTSDGAGGSINAIVGIRTPTADAKGQLVFFFHNRAFVGWDGNKEAVSVLGLRGAGPRRIAVNYVNLGPDDPVIGGTRLPAIITYRWDGHTMVPDRQPPPGVYGLNDHGTSAIVVKLAERRA